MKKTAFTLMEILLAMTIIGIIAGATANSLKNVSANKTKIAFQNNYSHMLKVIEDISQDETVYPAIYSSDFDSNGRRKKLSFCEIDNNNINNTGFPRKFKELTAGILESGETNGGNGVTFETKEGAYWAIHYVAEASRIFSGEYSNNCNSNEATNIYNADFIITFDVDGRAQGTDCPYSGSEFEKTTTSTCKKPDTFRFGLSRSNKILTDPASVYNGKNLKNFLEDNNYLKSKY